LTGRGPRLGIQRGNGRVYPHFGCLRELVSKNKKRKRKIKNKKRKRKKDRSSKISSFNVFLVKKI
jgi:hypothetical protein